MYFIATIKQFVNNLNIILGSTLIVNVKKKIV
jgi:hypothetical protein